MARSVIAPIATPFRADGSVCAESMAALCEHLKLHVSAVVPALTTGEGWLLSEAQWADVVRYSLTHFGVGGVIAGIELPTTTDTVARAMLAGRMGCRAIIATKPFGKGVTQQQIYDHYAALADVTDLQVFVYNETYLTQNRIEPETFLRLAGLSRIAGIKESTGNPMLTRWLLDHAGQLPSILQGREELLEASQDCDGFLIALANLAPALCAQAIATPNPAVWSEVRAVCETYRLLSDDWIVEIKAELHRRGVFSTPSMVADLPPAHAANAAAPPQTRISSVDL